MEKKLESETLWRTAGKCYQQLHPHYKINVTSTHLDLYSCQNSVFQNSIFMLQMLLTVQFNILLQRFRGSKLEFPQNVVPSKKYGFITTFTCVCLKMLQCSYQSTTFFLSICIVFQHSSHFFIRKGQQTLYGVTLFF